MGKRIWVMADVLREDTPQCSLVQERVGLLAVRQELWDPLPDVMEHWLCLLQASDQHILPGEADSAAVISECSIS